MAACCQCFLGCSDTKLWPSGLRHAMASYFQVLLSSYHLVVLSRLHQNHLLLLPRWDACDS